MSKIIPSSDLRNKYSEVSEFCHTYEEPVYITKNGSGDLVVMSIKQYESLTAKQELYNSILQGLKSIDEGKVVSVDDAFSMLKNK